MRQAGVRSAAPGVSPASATVAPLTRSPETEEARRLASKREQGDQGARGGSAREAEGGTRVGLGSSHRPVKACTSPCHLTTHLTSCWPLRTEDLLRRASSQPTGTRTGSLAAL